MSTIYYAAEYLRERERAVTHVVKGHKARLQVRQTEVYALGNRAAASAAFTALVVRESLSYRAFPDVRCIAKMALLRPV